jgi:hypothetical protein
VRHLQPGKAIEKKDTKAVLLKISLRGDAGILEFVEYQDGTLGVHRDGSPVEGCQWNADQFDRALKEFTDLQRRLEHG